MSFAKNSACDLHPCSYRYYCEFFRAVNDSACAFNLQPHSSSRAKERTLLVCTVWLHLRSRFATHRFAQARVPTNCVRRNGTGCGRPRNSVIRAAALFLSFACTRTERPCRLLPRRRPPDLIVVILNKMFEGELFKLQVLRRYRHRIALVLAMTSPSCTVERLLSVRQCCRTACSQILASLRASSGLAYKQDWASVAAGTASRRAIHFGRSSSSRTCPSSTGCGPTGCGLGC